MTAKLQKSKQVNSLIQQLIAQSQGKFTGRLEIKATGGRQWDLYFCVGRLMWATNNFHPIRQLRRYLSLHCPKIRFETLIVPDSDKFSSWTYQVLWVLEKRQKISKQQSAEIVNDIVTEELFDLLQQSTRGGLAYTCYEQNSLEMVRMQLTVVNLKAVFGEAQQNWQAWVKAGLGTVSPNLAPALKNPQALKQKITPKAYATLAKRLNGQRTFRELAQLTQQDSARLLKSLSPYIRQKWIELVQLPDLPRPVKTEPKPPAQPATPTTLLPPKLIACLDDDPQTCKLMERLLAQAGYRSLTISDSMQAIPILLEQKPDLLFLDLVMPVANGYEVCTQLRRISALKDMPIVILTGNDGMIDRMRAKMVKASGFLTKPINSQKVVTTVRKYLFVSPKTPEV
jgi:two-component system, chemotaxis family, response regulator PixG